MATKLPTHHRTVTPYLTVSNAMAAIEFYQEAFSAKQVLLMQDEQSGKVAHAELLIGDSLIMLADEFPQSGNHSPITLGGVAVTFAIYVDDVDTEFDRIIALGAEGVRAVQDQFHGDRSGMLKDPFGHVWTIATHKESFTAEELQARFKKMMQQ